MPIKVLIVDDHKLIRDALEDLFADTDDISVVGQCADGSEVTPAVARLQPDVVLMDLRMPVMDGLTATAEVLAAHPTVRVIVLTGALTPSTAMEARAIGAAGYLLKEEDPARLPEHVRTVAAGGLAWSPVAADVCENGWDAVANGATDAAPSPYVDESPTQFR